MEFILAVSWLGLASAAYCWWKNEGVAGRMCNIGRMCWFGLLAIGWPLLLAKSDAPAWAIILPVSALAAGALYRLTIRQQRAGGCTSTDLSLMQLLGAMSIAVVGWSVAGLNTVFECLESRAGVPVFWGVGLALLYSAWAIACGVLLPSSNVRQQAEELGWLAAILAMGGVFLGIWAEADPGIRHVLPVRPGIQVFVVPAAVIVLCLAIMHWNSVVHAPGVWLLCSVSIAAGTALIVIPHGLLIQRDADAVLLVAQALSLISAFLMVGLTDREQRARCTRPT